MNKAKGRWAKFIDYLSILGMSFFEFVSQCVVYAFLLIFTFVFYRILFWILLMLIITFIVEEIVERRRKKKEIIEYYADLAASKVFFYDPENERRKANREVFW